MAPSSDPPPPPPTPAHTHTHAPPLNTQRPAKFSNVHSLTLHLKGAFSGTQSEVSFVGLKGDFEPRSRRPVEAVYELRPVPGAHEVPGASRGGHFDVA